MSTPGQRHIPALDGLRGIAIALVLVHHLVRLEPGGVIGAAVQRLVYASYVGVDLFFVLSGYLITGILLATRAREDYYPRFLVRRSLRIFPLYFATLAFIFLCFRPLARAMGSEPEPVVGHVLAYVFYVSNFAIASVGHFGWRPTDITWSLAIEEQFYLLFPWLVRGVRTERLVVVLCALAALALLIRCGLFATFGREAAVPCYVLPFCRMDALLLGGVAATLEISPNEKLARALGVLGRLALVAVPVLALLGLVEHESPFMMTAGYSIVALAMLALVARARTASGVLGRVLTTRGLVFLGTRSYGIYLFHSLIEGALRKAPGLRDVFADDRLRTDPWTSFAFVALALAVTLAAAELSFKVFEQPVLSMRDRIRTLHTS